MSPKINFSALVNLFKTLYAVQGQSPVEHGFQNGENKSGTNSITRTIRKKPNERSKADRRPSPDDSMTGKRELGTTSRTVGPESCRLSTFKPLVISTYNVRTLHQQGKTHQLFMGCSDVGIDIIGIQEHRLITKEPTEELWSDDKNWVLVYSSATDQRQGGVGLLMSKHIYKCLQSVTPVTKRIISATFHGNPQLTVTSVYAPTECSLPDDKDDFYNDLNNHLEQMKPHNIHLVVGDFNARVGLDSHSIHPEVIGRHCFYDTTNNNGERLVDLCEEFQLRPAQMRFPHPRHRLWTWMHPSGSTHQLDHILINNKWKNSLLNCRAYNSVELDPDHRIVSIRLVCSLRSSRAKPCKRPKFNWKKLQDAATKEQFQLELSNRFDVLQCNNMSTLITERYESFENAVEEVAEKVVGRCSPCGMPSWVSDRTKQLRTERDVAKRKYLLSKSKQSREIWRKLNSSLNESYKADEMARLNKQMEELQLADSKGDYSTTWKIIHDLSGKDRNPKVKVKTRDGAPPKSDKDLLAEWQAYFSSLLNNENGQAPSDLPQPAAQDLPIHDHPPTLEETLEAIRQMKTNKAAGLDWAITAEALQGGGDAMADVIHCFCAEVYSNLTPPDQWITSVIVPLPKKGTWALWPTKGEFLCCQ